MKKLTTIIALVLLIGCAKAPSSTYEIGRCMNRPIPPVLVCEIECGFYVTHSNEKSHIKDVNHMLEAGCFICFDDFKNIISYVAQMDIYNSDECVQIILK